MKKALSLALIFFLGVFSLQAVSASSFSGTGLVVSLDLDDFETPLEDEDEGMSNQIPEEEEKHFSIEVFSPVAQDSNIIRYPRVLYTLCEPSFAVLLPPPDLT